MSYDPSQANGIKAIQVDIDASSVLSDDITTHSEVTIRSRNKYFIDSKILLTTDSSSTGYLLWEKWSNFSFMGGVYRSNAVSGTGTGLDDSNASSNTPNTNLTLTSQSSGSGGVTRKSFRAFWRIE
jgi:hypothetical protein